MLVIWVFEEVGIREAIVSFQEVVVESRDGEDIIGLLEEPLHRGSRNDDFGFSREVGEDVASAFLRVLPAV
jgi:hypothetical protein